MERRKLGDQADKEALDTIARAGPKRDRSWEAEQRDRGIVATYRGIPPDVQARIKAIACEHQVNIGDVARRFLEHGIAAYESGDLDLEPVTVSTKKSLYPDE